MVVWVLSPPYKKDFIKEGRCEQETSLFDTTYPPLSMAQIAAILRRKFDIKLYDCIAQKINEKRIIQLFKNQNPKIVFINTTTPTFENDINLTKQLSEISKTTKFYVYGVHAKYFSNEKYGKNIILLSKEPEEIAYELIGKNFSFEDLPTPAWDLVEIKNYKLPIKNKSFLLIQTSRGCPYSCIFCTAPFYYGKKYRKKRVTSIIEEIKAIKKLGIDEIVFYSEIFTFDKDYVIEICNEIIKQNLKINWMCNSRIDSVDENLLKLMKKSGCYMISYGIENFNQNILNKSKKGINANKIRHTIGITNKSGILSFGHFILGLPGDSNKNLIKNIKISSKIGLDFAFYYIATPFPGSALFEFFKNKKNKFSNIHYNKNQVNKNLNLEKYQNKAYKHFYFNLNMIKTIVRIVSIMGIKYFPTMIISGIKSTLKILKNEN